MILLRLAWRSLLNRRGSVLLAVLTIAVSVFLLLAVDKLRRDARSSFLNSVAGVDLIVGPRTGAVQLLLYSVFHIGEPTNNIRMASFDAIAALPAVAWAVPLSLGDSHRGYRVIGTSADFFEHYRHAGQQPLAFAAGRRFDGLFEAVVGAEVARALDYRPGSQLVVGHGGGRVALHQHDQLPFVVAGVLQASGTPLDRSVLVPLEAIGAIHQGWESGRPRPGLQPDPHELQEHAHELRPAAISAALLGLKQKVAGFALQRSINEWPDEPLQAIMPAATLLQLWSLVAVAEQALLVVAGCVVVAGLLGMLAILLATVDQRRREMALLRSVGAAAWQVFALLLTECLLLLLAGIALGLLLLALASVLLAPWLATLGLHLASTLVGTEGLRLLAAVLGGGLLLGLVPAAAAYGRALADGLTVRL